MAKLEVATAGDLPPIIGELEGKREEIEFIREVKLGELYIDLEAIIGELKDPEIIEKVEDTKRKLDFIYVPLYEAEGAVSGAIGTLIDAYEAKLGLEKAIADAMGALEFAKFMLHLAIGPIHVLQHATEEVEGTIDNLQDVIAGLEGVEVYTELPPIFEELIGKWHGLQRTADLLGFTAYVLDVELGVLPGIVGKLDYIMGGIEFAKDEPINYAIGTLIEAYEAPLAGFELADAIGDAMGALEHAKGVLHDVIGGPTRLLEYVLGEVEGTMDNLQDVIDDLEGVTAWEALEPIIAELIPKYRSLEWLTYLLEDTWYYLDDLEAPDEVLEKLDAIIENIVDWELPPLGYAIGTLVTAFNGKYSGEPLATAISDAIGAIEESKTDMAEYAVIDILDALDELSLFGPLVPFIEDAIAELQLMSPLDLPFLEDALAELEEVIAELG